MKPFFKKFGSIKVCITHSHAVHLLVSGSFDMKLHHRIQISRNKTEISASCVYKFGCEDFEEVRILTLFDLNDRRLTSMRMSLPAFRALQRYEIMITDAIDLSPCEKEM